MRGEDEMFILRAQKGDNNSLFIELCVKSSIAIVPEIGCL
jgi:hypothetical protein